MYFIVLGGESVSTSKIGHSDTVALNKIYTCKQVEGNISVLAGPPPSRPLAPKPGQAGAKPSHAPTAHQPSPGGPTAPGGFPPGPGGAPMNMAIMDPALMDPALMDPNFIDAAMMDPSLMDPGIGMILFAYFFKNSDVET